MQIIGINGFKRSGKGETARILSEVHAGVVYEVGFADKLKIIAAKALGYEGPPRDLIALMDEYKETGEINAYLLTDGDDREVKITGRQYLQHLGNHARDVFGENFWIDQVLPNHEWSYETAMQELYAMYACVDCVAITDLRYPNEAERVRGLGGVVWRVNRPGVESDGHASEIPLPDDLVDYEIDNSGDFDHLTDEVYAALGATC